MKIHKISFDFNNNWGLIKGYNKNIDILNFGFYEYFEYEFSIILFNFEFTFCLQTKEQRKKEVKYLKEMAKTFKEDVENLKKSFKTVVAVKKRKTTNKKG